MKITYKIALATAIITAVIVVIKVTKNNNTERQLTRIADEGYETAHDILYPAERFGPNKRVHYGPVLPPT